MASSKPNTYTVIFTRHGESESNHPKNFGVDKMDPLLTTKETRQDFGNDETPGRDFCREETTNYYRELYAVSNNDVFFHKTSPIITSSLTRAIQTAIISLPSERLKSGSSIIVSPLVAEQTAWFSDRTRPVRHLESLVEKELINKFGCSNPNDVLASKAAFNLHQLAYSPSTNGDSLGFQFAQQTRKQRCTALTETEREECGKPWHLKNPETLWHPSNLIRRAEEATRMLLTIAREVKDIDGRTPALVVFGHGGFINYLTKNVDVTEEQINSTPPGLTNWFPGETRVFKITDRNPDSRVPDVCLLEETEASLAAHLERREKWQRENPENAVKKNALDHTKMPKTKEQNDDMRLRLQLKVASMVGSLGEFSSETEALYERSWKEKRNPIEVDGNCVAYCKDVLNYGE